MKIMYIKVTYIGRAGFAGSSPMPRSLFTDAHVQVREHLKHARLDAGISQTELARRLGRPQQFISYIEMGERRVDVVEFYAIAQALGLDPKGAIVGLFEQFPDQLAI
jgi:ribosome-binding protein aMBF1 (putative translation factor)